MATADIQETQHNLEAAFAIFKDAHPEVGEAMKVMNISFAAYLQALAALQEETSISGNATSS